MMSAKVLYFLLRQSHAGQCVIFGLLFVKIERMVALSMITYDIEVTEFTEFNS